MRKFEKVSRLDDVKLPERATKNSAGYDFYAIDNEYIPAYEMGSNPVMIPTGVKVQMQPDEFLILVNRSSNPAKKGLVIPNSLGVIDADYYNNPDNEGEMFFPFYNLSGMDIIIKKGEKLGQGIFQKYLKTDDDNAQNDRSGGFGSTGK